MSYQSFKRVLGGDTHLERKCRILFGVSLSLLIAGAFWYAERLAHKLVIEKTANSGKEFVTFYLVLRHAILWDQDRQFSKELDRMLNSMQSEQYYLDLLALDDTPSSADFGDWGDDIHVPPRDSEDHRYVGEIRQRFAQQLANEQAAARMRKSDSEKGLPSPAADIPGPAAGTLPEPPVAGSASPPTSAIEVAEPDVASRPVYVLKKDRRLKEYHYYQPIYWQSGCITGICHDRQTQDGKLPLRVAKVVMPSGETEATLATIFATLVTTALVTVVLAMLALYVVVRYVIVKPLKHLRDISDEVRRGNTSLRANLWTNDEFEELGESYNRMLRHLVDAQEELRRANVSLDGKVDQLAQANMQLFEMNRLKSEFLARMSHELRTPLNSIIGFSDVLQGIESLDEKQRRYAANIARSGRILLDMINDILDLAKLESGRMQRRPTEFSLEAVVAANCHMMRSLSEEKNIDLEVNVEPELPPVYQDQGKIQQILTNLLSNAVKFTPQGGRISVTARHVGQQIELIVEDTGVGISEEDRAVIFEKFRQGTVSRGGGDHLTREYSGTGLGLSIVKELCRLLEGEISFVSEIGKGTTFTVHLPWRLSDTAPHQTDLDSRLSDLTRPGRLERELGEPATLAHEPSMERG